MNTNLIPWIIPAVGFLVAFLALSRRFLIATLSVSSEPLGRVDPKARPLAPKLATTSPRSKASPGAEEPRFDPLSRENLARICSRFGIRSISILPPKGQARCSGKADVEILVEFEPNAELDGVVVLRLRQELFAIFARPVYLVCRNSAELAAQRKMFEKARVLYAA